MTAPGIYKNLSMSDYLADPCEEPALSSGLIHTLTTLSPQHAWAEHPRLNPAFQSEESSTFDAGSAAHALLAGEDRLEVIEADDFRSKAAKEHRDTARAGGRIPILAGKLPMVQEMVAVAKGKIARSHDLADVFPSCEPEQVMVWQAHGVTFKGRCDWLSRDRKTIIDYKTTGGVANPAKWNPYEHGYDIQACLYLQGLRALGGDEPSFFWLVQENYAPYACAIVSPSEQMLELATEKIRIAAKVWRKCLDSGVWPGYDDRTYYSEPPPYEVTKWDIAKILLEGI